MHQKFVAVAAFNEVKKAARLKLPGIIFDFWAARAAAVMKALVQRGIDAKGLAAHGAGPNSLFAANATDEGLARSRRVELVAQP
jgi:hypothetical protein